MSPSSRRVRRVSRNRTQQISPTSQWLVVQVEPGNELEAARLVSQTWEGAGLNTPNTVPRPQTLRSRRHADVPYRGVIFISTDELDSTVISEDDLLTRLEEHRDIIRGVIYEAENLLIEFEGLKLDDGSGSVNEAISQLNHLAFREMRFSGQASMLQTEAKLYLPGERGREVLAEHYVEIGELGFPDQSDFIEARVYFSNYHRELLSEVPGLIDFVGGQ